MSIPETKEATSNILGLPGTGGKDSCQGDSGGPLVTVSPAGEFIQIGVVSAGDAICGPRGKPTLFTILNEDRLAWVQSVIDK